MAWYVRDNHTGYLINKGKKYDSLRKAHSAANRKDLAYGAVRYSAIYKEE